MAATGASFMIMARKWQYLSLPGHDHGADPGKSDAEPLFLISG
jgi:hypothetical protein